MRVWVDITNSPHVLFFRPLIRLLQARGHDVSITAREYAQTLELLELHGIAHEVVGPRHGGAGVVGKARALVGRLPALRRFAKTRALRPGARARLARADARGAAPRHPERDRTSTTSSPRSSTSSAAARRRGSSSRTRSPPSGSHG